MANSGRTSIVEHYFQHQPRIGFPNPVGLLSDYKQQARECIETEGPPELQCLLPSSIRITEIRWYRRRGMSTEWGGVQQVAVVRVETALSDWDAETRRVCLAFCRRYQKGVKRQVEIWEAARLRVQKVFRKNEVSKDQLPALLELKGARKQYARAHPGLFLLLVRKLECKTIELNLQMLGEIAWETGEVTKDPVPTLTIEVPEETTADWSALEKRVRLILQTEDIDVRFEPRNHRGILWPIFLQFRRTPREDLSSSE